MKVVKNVKVLSKDEALQRLQDNRKNKSLNINIKQ
jgi:cell division protein FtsX